MGCCVTPYAGTEIAGVVKVSVRSFAAAIPGTASAAAATPIEKRAIRATGSL